MIIVLARGGSKRIKNKNIKLICGRPLIHWTLDALRPFCDVYVATDSDEIKEAVEVHGTEVIKRPPVRDDETSEEAILNLPLDFDHFTLVQCTSPLVTSQDISWAQTLKEEGNFDSVVSGVTQFKRRWHNNYCDAKEQPVQILNGAVMVSSITTIKQFKYIAGGRCGFYPMTLDTYFEIDTPEEFEIVEALLKARIHKTKKVFVFDVDGQIFRPAVGGYQHVTPISENIHTINQLKAKGHKIILYTSRGALTGIDWEDHTRKQLRDYNVLYDELHFNKPYGDFYSDDKSIAIGQLKEML